MYYRVVIKEWDGHQTVETLKWTTNRNQAEKIDDGLSVNLNHEKFYTWIEQSEVEPVEI